MVDPIVFFSFVEDQASKAVASRLLSFICERTGLNLTFAPGHPVVTGGCGTLKIKAKKWLSASRPGINSFFLADLDSYQAPNELGSDWFGVKCLSECPPNFIFRICKREIESWIMADRTSFARYLGVSTAVFPESMDELPDPKQFLLNVIRTKCKKKCYLEMLPRNGQCTGISYNPMLVDYISEHWSPVRASLHSASLARSLARVSDVLEHHFKLVEI